MQNLIFALILAIGPEPVDTFYPGDRAAVTVDVDGDHVGEKLVVTSYEPDPENGGLGLFEFTITLTDTRGNILYSSEEVGEYWFSLEKSEFAFENGGTREVALVRSGCSGTGIHVYAWFIHKIPGADTVLVAGEGNQGLYDLDKDGTADMLVSRYRNIHLGGWGYSSPWVPLFSRPHPGRGWQMKDFTFAVLADDQKYRQEWIEDLLRTYKILAEGETEGMMEPDHLRNLKMLIQALSANDIEEARRIFYTAF